MKYSSIFYYRNVLSLTFDSNLTDIGLQSTHIDAIGK